MKNGQLWKKKLRIYLQRNIESCYRKRKIKRKYIGFVEWNVVRREIRNWKISNYLKNRVRYKH